MPHTPSLFSVTEQLHTVLQRPIEPEDRRRATLHLIDWLGCAMIGRSTNTGAILSADLRWDGFPFTSDARAEISESNAFALGGLGSLYEMDDLHRTALLHPGPVVVPAALAFGAQASGRDFLDAIIRGYEAMIRIGAAVGPAHYAFYHNTGTCGGFGAAVAAACVRGLDREKTVHALGLAGSVAGGLWQCRNEPVASKAFHIAEAARRGVAAARLAERGLTAPRYILEGPQGFFSAQAPDGDVDAVLADPYGGWKIWETSFKPWPACRHVHPTIDAALALKRQIGADRLKDIVNIGIKTYSDAILFCDRADPETELQAKFSLQHATAVTLRHGKPQLDDFKPEAIANRDIATLREKVRVEAAEAFSRAYPSHFGSRVTITLADGTVLSNAVADALGDSETPMQDAEIIAKASLLMAASGLSRDRIEAIIAAALALAEGTPLTAFRDAATSANLC